ncbi:hypothetical protein OA955_00385 [Candidatus Marinimicrobia bacterium]|nr:hypothetical protein [Candidatus Neomarinimicrobiota bacterium]
MDKRTAHNFTWVPVFIIGIVLSLLGGAWCIQEEPWLLDQSHNKALLQTSFNMLFSGAINNGLPLHLITMYRFLGLCLLTIGLLIMNYVYVTRMGTKTARNSIFLILIATLLGFYFLLFNYLPSTPLIPVLHFFSFCLMLSVFFSRHLPD